MRVVATNNRSFVDLAASAAGGIGSLFESALSSGVSIDEVPNPGAVLEIEVLPKKYELPKELPRLKPVAQLICIQNQNLQDLTIQTSGSLEHIFEMALLNGISITGNPVPGKNYKAEFEAPDNEIVNYYAVKGLRPATGLSAEALLQQLFEIGLFEFGLFE